jgi:O-antigen/teichoic acid export membrane protein
LDGLKKYGHAKNILKRSFLFYSLVVVIGIACVFLLSEWFIAFVAKDYLPSLPIFKVIVSLGLIFGYNSIYTNYLRGLGRVKKYALLMLIQNIVLIVASFILLNSMM